MPTKPWFDWAAAPGFVVNGLKREELIAANMTTDEIAGHIGVDTLGYLSLDGMLACVNPPRSQYCTACWSGEYKVPVDVPQSKFSFERDQLKMF